MRGRSFLVKPGIPERWSFGEEEDVGFYALAIWREGAAREAENGVKIAILG